MGKIYFIKDFLERRKNDEMAERIVTMYVQAAASFNDEEYEHALSCITEMLETIPEIGDCIWTDFCALLVGKDVPGVYLKEFCKIGTRIAGNMKNAFMHHDGRFIGTNNDYLRLIGHLTTLKELAYICRDGDTLNYISNIKQDIISADHGIESIVRE